MADHDDPHRLKGNKQRIENLRLAQRVVENADQIRQLYDTDWSEVQRTKIAQCHDEGAQLLEEAERESKYNLQQNYSLEDLMRSCHLEMQPRDLYSLDDKPNIVDLLAVKKLIQDRKNNYNKGRVASFTEMLESALAHIDAIEAELRPSRLDATELAAVPHRTLEAVEKAMNVTSIDLALRQTQEKIAELMAADVDLANRIKAAEASGDMVLLEELAMQQIQLQEKRLVCVREKFTKIAQVEAENEQFRHIFEVQRAGVQAAQVIQDAKRHLKQRCDVDLKAINEMVQRSHAENTEKKHQFKLQKDQSDRMLAKNLEDQDEGWRRIQDIEKQLRKLAQERQAEIERRLEDNKNEGLRQVQYNQLLEVVSQHRTLLEITAQNCEIMQRCTVKMKNLVEEACSAINIRYNSLARELAALKFKVHVEYLGFFRFLYKNLGLMIYRKERKQEELGAALAHANIHLQFCVETFDPAAKKHSLAKQNLTRQFKSVHEELKKLTERRAQILEDFRPTEEFLIAERYEFVDPVSEEKEGILQWRTEMVRYRSQLTEQEEVKIKAEREEIKHQRTLIESGADTAASGYRAIEPPQTQRETWDPAGTGA